MPGFDTIFAAPWQLGATALVIAVASAIYVLFGFGAGLIAVGALGLILPDVRDAVVVLLLLTFPAEIGVVVSSWREIRWRDVAAICSGIAVGVPAGTALLRYVDTTALIATLGAVLVVAGTAFLLVPSHRRVSWPRWVAPMAGLVSGLLSGLLGTGGPPLILYYRLAGLGKATFRGMLMAVFLAITVVRLPSYAIAGLITPARLASAAMLFPAMALGALLGNRVHVELQESTFQKAVAAGLAVLGVALLLSATGPGGR